MTKTQTETHTLKTLCKKDNALQRKVNGGEISVKEFKALNKKNIENYAASQKDKNEIKYLLKKFGGQ